MSARHHAARRTGPGLPGRLPEGETLLWQGAPDARTLLVRVFHLRFVGAYFALLIAASAVTGWVAVWGTLHLVRTRTFFPFVVYRVLAGASVIAVAATGLR